jgi:hypothetical protein
MAQLLSHVTHSQALNCILRCGPKAGVVKTGRPKKFKKDHVDRMVRLLEEGLETTIPASAAKPDAVSSAAPTKCPGVEIIDADGCCVLCGGGGADYVCTFPCPSTSSEADAGDVVSVCGCM